VRDLIRALRQVRLTAAEKEELPFSIADFSIYDREPLCEELQAIATSMREPARRVASYKILVDRLWSQVGGLLVSKRFLPNVEQHPTLASFATQIFKALCTANKMIQVGGFRYDVTKALRRHLCRAGRSEAHVGFYETDPIVIFDIVSLYPTSMACQKMLYALGCELEGKKAVRCSHQTAYIEPVDGIMKAGIWKVKIHKQPNGVVIPAQDKTGYYWDRDCAHNMTTLLTTPDVESLKITHAEYEVLEGITFDDATNQLYTEYIAIFQSEKGRQDDLKKGKPVQIFDGEIYSAGIREATKLGMNILSGKEITRPYTRKREIIHNEQLATSQDTANEQRQVKLSMQARAALDSPKGISLTSYRRKITKARQVPRLIEPPTKIGPSTWVAEWREIPESASYSHINGYHIYGVARWIMTQIYATIGYDKFYVTETDSLAMAVKDIPKLYPLLSCFGDPLVFANGERALGLFPGAPECTKSKQFGQLECETTEKLCDYFCKTNNWYKDMYEAALVKPDEEWSRKNAELIACGYNTEAFLNTNTKKSRKWRERNASWLAQNQDGRRIKSLAWRGGDGDARAELLLNGVPTGLRGPFLCVGGKKIYAQYLMKPTGDRIFLKSRFKGLSFGQDWVIEPQRVTMNGKSYAIEPPLFTAMSVMKRSDRVRYALTQLADFARKPGLESAVLPPAEFSRQQELSPEEQAKLINPASSYIPASVHKLQYSDIINYIQDRKLYVIQSRVSESSTVSMTSKQNVVMKELELRTGGPDALGMREIAIRSGEVATMSLRAMARAISTCGEDLDSKCECCDEQGTLIMDFKAFCAAHVPEDEEVRKICKHHNRFGMMDCGEFAERDGFCINHSGFKHNHDVNIYCEHTDTVGGREVQCRELANPEGILKGLSRCDKHLHADHTAPSAQCLRQFKYVKNGSLQCQNRACERAITNGYQLCYKHHLENNGLQKARNDGAIIDKARAAELAAEITATKQSKLVSSIAGTVVYCAFLDARGRVCGRQIEIERMGPGVTLCRNHAKRELFKAKKAAASAAKP